MNAFELPEASSAGIVRRAKRSGTLATVGLFSVLGLFLTFAVLSTLDTYRNGEGAKRAAQLSAEFAQARFLVRVEESNERQYRIEPNPEALASFRDVAAQLDDTLKSLHDKVHARDQAMVEQVQQRHQHYLAIVPRMFAAVDAGDLDAVKRIDEGEADPVFDQVESWVDEAAEQYRLQAQRHLAALSAVQRQQLMVTPPIYAFGCVLVTLFWFTLRRTQREKAETITREAALARRSERRLHGLVQNASDLILICSRNGSITYNSPAAKTAWHYDDGSLIGDTLPSLIHEDDHPAFREMWDQLQRIVPTGAPDIVRKIELRLRSGAGEWRFAELVGTNLLHDPALAGVVLTARDITERKSYEQQLTQQAFYDALTGLPNRVLLRDRLEQALVRASRRKDAVGLVFIDLDNFKLINDSLGHHMGDRLLVEAAARLRCCIRAQDTVARLSGDEFVIVLELLSGEEDALSIAQAIQNQFSRPVILDGRELVISASIGIALSSPERDTAETLLRNADVAMYRAKSEGRARSVIFDPTMHSDSLARLELESDLRHAISHGELRVHYQPIVTMETGVVSEVEALVRWQHPSRGLIPPNDFIPLAEETGLIIPLGLWVMEEACRQTAEWQAQFPTTPPLTVSVNLSPRQFQQQSLVADIVQVLQTTGLAPGCLKLEITEGIIMRDAEATIRTLWELKRLGIQLAVDDFGTGYSSLSYLKRLPLDVLKIDRSFVSGVGQNHEDTAIIHAIMALAKSLNLRVTGEGIETEDQAALLEKWGCDRGQGFLFSKALDRDSTRALLAASADLATAGKSQMVTPAA